MKTILGFRLDLDGALYDEDAQRTAAFVNFYRSLDITYQVAGGHAASLAKEGWAAGEHDRSVTAVRELEIGRRAALHPVIYRGFQDLVEQARPQVVQLEGPFLWPVVDRLRREGALAGVPLIYSSHQHESVARMPILKCAGVSESVRRRTAALLDELEAEICQAASAVTAVSQADASAYVAMGAHERLVHVIPEGAARLTFADQGGDEWRREFEGRRPLLFAGPDVAWAVEDFLRLAAPEGLFFAPPEKMLAICGGISNRIFQSPIYQKFLHGNSERVMFFPSMSDADRGSIRSEAKAILLPIETGSSGGSAASEALVGGKWLVATSYAMRRHAAFLGSAGVLVCDTPKAFRAAMLHALNAPLPVLSDEDLAQREALYWDRCFGDSGYLPPAS